MNKETFGRGLKKLCAYYERSIPGRDTTDLWLSKLERIPNECMDWMVKTISDRHEMFPRNLTNVMLQLWPEWLNHHPDKRSTFYDDACQDCDSSGWLHVRGKDGLVYAYRCKCGRLRNTAPAAYITELLSDGCEEDSVDVSGKYRVEPKVRGNVGGINWSDYLEGVV